MSLHLIESTKLPTRSSRKRFGATASIVMHATLVAGAFTAASAAPVATVKPVENVLTYVAPKPVKVVSGSVSSAENKSSSFPSTAIDLSLPDITMPSEIPVDIPPIDPGRKVDFSSTRDFARRGYGSGTAIGVDHAGSLLLPDSVMSDLQVDRQVSILSGYRTPRYPEMLRAAGVEETLNATFVVDTLGRVEAGSLEIPSAQHAQFVAAVREALSNAKFRPAEVHGRRVRQRVMQAFVFSLQRN